MACPLTYSLGGADCEIVSGGIQEIYIKEFCDIDTITVANYLVSAITLIGAPSSSDWAKYTLREEVGLLEATENSNIQNGSLFYDSALSFTLNKMEAAKSNELYNLAIQRLLIIIKDNNGKYFLIGDERGARKTGGTNSSSTGTAFGDANGYSLSFLAKQTHDIYEVDSAVVDALTFFADL